MGRTAHTGTATNVARTLRNWRLVLQLLQSNNQTRSWDINMSHCAIVRDQSQHTSAATERTNERTLNESLLQERTPVPRQKEGFNKIDEKNERTNRVIAINLIRLTEFQNTHRFQIISTAAAAAAHGNRLPPPLTNWISLIKYSAVNWAPLFCTVIAPFVLRWPAGSGALHTQQNAFCSNSTTIIFFAPFTSYVPVISSQWALVQPNGNSLSQ